MALQSMTESKLVTCGKHGTRHAAFVCQHLVDGIGLGFFTPNRPRVSEDESDEQAAWCADCEKIRQGQDGWNDISEGFAGVTMICDVCFDAARVQNQRE